MPRHWTAVDLRTGTVLAELPYLVEKQPLKAVLGSYQTATVDVPVVGRLASPEWLRATKPFAAALIAVDTASQLPVWGGIVTQRNRTAGAGVASLTLTTAEGYLNRRFIRVDQQYVGSVTSRVAAGADLLAKYVVDGASGRKGLPLRVVTLPGTVGQDASFAASDDKSVYSAFSDLAFEWTITWERQSSPERITPVATLGERIGVAATAGLYPATTFASPGNLSDVEVAEDWSEGQGANDVTATSTGTGSVRPTSDAQTYTADERPTVELRYSAGSNIVKLADLDALAAAKLSLLRNGSTAYTLTALTDKAPQFGVNWGLGDDIRVLISGPEFPDAVDMVARAAGVSIDAQTFSPILVGSGS